MMKTLVLLGHHEIGGQQFHHGDELPPNTLPAETVDSWIDRKWLMELDSVERRSLFRLFAPFSRSKETEELTEEEKAELCLPA